MSGNTLYFIALTLVVPLALAKLLVGANWLQTGAAFQVLWGVLLLLGLMWGSNWGERFGWPFIFSMFVSIPAVPVIALVLKKTGTLA